MGWGWVGVGSGRLGVETGSWRAVMRAVRAWGGLVRGSVAANEGGSRTPGGGTGWRTHGAGGECEVRTRGGVGGQTQRL